MAWGSEHVTGDEEPGDEKHEKAEEHEFQPLLDEAAHRLAEGIDQSRFQSEPRAARDNGKNNEQPEIVACESRRDGHKFVRNGGQSLDQDDRRAPFRVSGAERCEVRAISVSMNQPAADRVIKE